MEVNLSVIGQIAKLRDWVPHKVAAKASEEMFRGVQIGQQALGVTKAQLIDEFGGEAVEKLDSLKESDYRKRFEEMKNEYLQRKLEMKGLELGNIERANMAKVEGMVLEIDGKKPSRDVLENLPQKDFEKILSAIQEIESQEDTENLSEPSEG